MPNQQQSIEDKFNSIIEKIGYKDVKDINKLFVILSDEEKKDLMEFLVENPNSVKSLIENFRKKKDIIAKQDKKAWEKLLNEEKKELEALSRLGS